MPLYFSVSGRPAAKTVPMSGWRGFVFAMWTLMLNACPQLSFAQDHSQITLTEALDRTLAQNPELRVFRFRELGLDGRRQTAGLRPGYVASAELENIAGSEPFDGVEAAELQLAISSVIELGGQREARLAVVDEQRAQLELERKAQALDLLGEVTRRYVDALAAQEALELAAQYRSLVEDALELVRERAAAGAGPEAEIRRAEANLRQADIALDSARGQLDYYRTALAAMWGERQPDFSSLQGELYRFTPGLQFQQLFERALANPAIRFLAVEERLREAQLRLARSESSADVSWSAGIKHFRGPDANALVAGVSIPLFSGKRQRGAIVSATAERDAVALVREAALLDLHTQLYRAFIGREQAMNSARVLRDEIVPLLTTALEETRDAYQRGLYSYQEWLAARQELIDARQQLIAQARKALRYGAEIEQLSAESLSSTRSNQEASQ